MILTEDTSEAFAKKLLLILQKAYKQHGSVDSASFRSFIDSRLKVRDNVFNYTTDTFVTEVENFMRNADKKLFNEFSSSIKSFAREYANKRLESIRQATASVRTYFNY